MTPPLWFANFLCYCLQVTLVVVAGTALPALFRLRAPRVLLPYWQGLLVACLALPLLQPWRSPAAASSFSEGSVSIRFQGVEAGATGIVAWLYPLIAGALVAGMLVRLGWLALGLRRLRAIRTAARAYDQIPTSVRELESRLGAAAGWYLTAEVDSPATFGFRPPSILLPDRFPALDLAFQRAIAGHELFHVARRHWIFNLAEELVLTLFWFHPAVAWVVHRIRLSREQTVDAEVVRLVTARKPYMSALLEIASGSPGTALGSAPTFLKERQLAQRIELLVKEVYMSKVRLSFSLTAIMGLLILAGGVAIWAFPLHSPVRMAVAEEQAAQESAAPGNIMPKLVTRVRPVYPPEAKKAGIEGMVVLRATIEKDGSISKLDVVRGDPQLAKAAADAVRQWRYAPMEKAVITDVNVNFTLARSGTTPPAEPNAKDQPTPAIPVLVPVSAVRPAYPAAAKAAGLEGNVILRITVEKDGSVSNVEALAGDSTLAKAAVDAVKQWRYAPTEKAAITDVTLSFRLPKESDANSDLSLPIVIYKPDPAYTKEARAAKLQGDVQLKVTVATDGTVSDVKVVRSLDKGLDENAIKALKTWKFLPATKGGKPVPFTSTVDITFKLF